MRKAAALFIIFIMLISLCGCSTISGFDSQTLMSPPKSNADQQAIYSLMENSDGTVNFIYPKSGDYRSAIITRDFTGDGVKDAVGFSSDPETGGSIVQFLTKRLGEWQVLGSFKNSAAQVDRVCFADLNNNGRYEIVIGWGSVQSLTATAYIYYYSSSGITESSVSTPYSEMCCADVDGDNKDEIFIATLYTPAETENDQAYDAVGTIYDCSMSSPQAQYSTKLNNNVTRYLSVQYGKICTGTAGMIIEGTAADGSYLTQLACVSGDGSNLYSPLSWDDAEKSFSYFRRPAGFSIFSQDVNNDGFTDFPLLTLLPGRESTETVSDAYLVSWTKFFPTASEGETVNSCIYNIAENYMFSIPVNGAGSYNCYSDTAARELRFNYVETGEKGRVIYSERLFTVKVFSAEEWGEQNVSEMAKYRKLPLASSDAVYTVYAADDSEETEAIINSISLINE